MRNCHTFFSLSEACKRDIKMVWWNERNFAWADINSAMWRLLWLKCNNKQRVLFVMLALKVIKAVLLGHHKCVKSNKYSLINRIKLWLTSLNCVSSVNNSRLFSSDGVLVGSSVFYFKNSFLPNLNKFPV